MKAIILLLGLTLSVACKTSKTKEQGQASGTKTSSSAEKGNHTETQNDMQDTIQTWTRDQAMAGPETFRVVVIFISIGSGTDPEARPILDQYLSDFRKKSGKSVSGIAIPWGREGEVDFCFELKDFDSRSQSEFVEGLRLVFKGRDLVQVEENYRNRFRR